MWQAFLFNLSSRPSSLFKVRMPHCLIFWHVRTVCSQAFRISFVENIQCSWTPLSFRMVSERTPSASPLTSLPSRSPRWQFCFTPPYFETQNLSHLMVILPKMASKSSSTHHPVSVPERQIQQWPPSLIALLTSCARNFSATHSRNLLDCFSLLCWISSSHMVSGRAPWEWLGLLVEYFIFSSILAGHSVADSHHICLVVLSPDSCSQNISPAGFQPFFLLPILHSLV